MCGLLGEINFRNGPDLAALARMSAALAARGPDGSGFYSDGRAAFGHRRLSILDLSRAAQQPMLDPELGLGIVFNGCIYNFRELRSELSGKGYRFFSDGDTEVIVKAWHAWGAGALQRFKGMFAFAIWERESGRVMLARDRLGIKPLYYAELSGGLRFASTLPALLAGGGIDTSIDEIALHNYMSYHAVVPAPRTILNGVRKLAPATLLTIDPDGSRREETYWQLAVNPSKEDRALTEQEWREAVRDAMAAAVRRRLVADVPVGVLLSGGLDSSLVVALLAEQGQTGLQTFSIGFESVRDLKGDEFAYSDLVARHFATDHHQIHIPGSRAIEALPGVLSAMSEPMMSHDAIGFYLLSEEVAKHVKVVQSGQGADEVFGGYHWYPPLMTSNDALADYARLYFDRDHDEMRETLHPSRITGDHSRGFIQDYLARTPSQTPLDQILQLDTEIMLVDDPVKRVDNMTMAFGLEARVPFLDHDLVELAARIPGQFKVRDGGKYILKQAARGVVPDEVIDRPKGYFPVPSLRYLRGPFLDYVRGIMDSPAARQRELFNPAYLERLLADPEGELTPKGHSKLWQVAVLEGWLQSHGL
jgi:asparagine synthase (glutamine-hydrolysing)